MIEEKSLDIFAEKMAKLRELFPEVLSEGKIDFKRLQSVLGDEAFFHKEHYELSWAGKSDARAQIQKATSATLIPDSVINAEESQNVFIEGENLEVLHVLQRAYFGKIKMIYIDPPYNTGNDSFVYPDDYSERQDEYKKRAGITDENGFLNKQDCWKKNSKENGQFHSVWLSMMYPRLYLARNLLREDGVIFISIDDNEQANLKLLCDEIFGAENFISLNARVTNSAKNTSNFTSVTHDYTLIYSKNIAILREKTESWKVPKTNLDEFLAKIRRLSNESLSHSDISEEIRALVKYPRFYEFDHYYYVDDHFLKKGPYASDKPGPTKGSTGHKNYSLPHPLTNQQCKIPSTGWAMNKEKAFQMLTEDRWHFGDDENTIPRPKAYLFEKSKSKITGLQFFDSQKDVKFLQKVGIYFENPKPVDFVALFASLFEDDNIIILDFFAGSGTTAHAVLDLNEQDGGNRQFICVQMPEVLDETSEAYKAGYRTIADICKTRITKVIEKIQSERDSQKQTDLIPTESKQVLGFKSFKLAPSNFKQWRSDVDETDILAQLELFKDSEQPQSENDAMLIELLLKAGLPLTTKVETHIVAEQVIYSVESGKLLFFFDDYNANVKDFIFTQKPKRVVCLNRVFKNDDQALTNFQLGLKDAGCELQII